mmetsp:Transcript_118995/g.282349  ORF Transcript_118995/g.282349 Transcript_118995/m.282349 type:complete len:203 (-) Transcript_118995:479-1087(-)
MKVPHWIVPSVQIAKGQGIVEEQQVGPSQKWAHGRCQGDLPEEVQHDVQDRATELAASWNCVEAAHHQKRHNNQLSGEIPDHQEHICLNCDLRKEGPPAAYLHQVEKYNKSSVLLDKVRLDPHGDDDIGKAPGHQDRGRRSAGAHDHKAHLDCSCGYSNEVDRSEVLYQKDQSQNAAANGLWHLGNAHLAQHSRTELFQVLR